MRPGQREFGCSVIEPRSLPLTCGMANRTVLRETCSRMIGILRVVVIPQVTGSAGARQTSVLAACVTGRAIHRNMRPAQGKLSGVVVEPCSLPLAGVMAKRAIL